MKRRWKGRFIKPKKCARLESLSKTMSEGRKCLENDESLPDAESTEKSGWRDGRRIVELGLLADQLRACKNCSNPLFLHNIDNEQRVGYASILYVSCECGFMNKVSTGKSHRPSDKTKRGMPVYDINTKAVLGKFISIICSFDFVPIVKQKKNKPVKVPTLIF